MTTQTLDAVFRDGAFLPLSTPSTLVEGQQVRLIVEVEEPDVLALAGAVFEGLSEAEVNDVERIALERREFFQKETP